MLTSPCSVLEMFCGAKLPARTWQQAAGTQFGYGAMQHRRAAHSGPPHNVPHRWHGACQPEPYDARHALPRPQMPSHAPTCPPMPLTLVPRVRELGQHFAAQRVEHLAHLVRDLDPHLAQPPQDVGQALRPGVQARRGRARRSRVHGQQVAGGAGKSRRSSAT